MKPAKNGQYGRRRIVWDWGAAATNGFAHSIFALTLYNYWAFAVQKLRCRGIMTGFQITS